MTEAWRRCRRCVALVCGVAIAHAAGASGEMRRPIAESERTLHNFGTVYRGQVVTAEFAIRNRGDGSLSMAVGSTGCSVRVGPLDSIGPGGRRVIQVQLDTAELSDNVLSFADIETSDLNHRAVRLILVAHVVTEFAVSEKAINLGVVRAGAPSRRRVTVKMSVPGAEILEARSTADDVRARLTTRTGGIAIIELFVSPKSRQGLFGNLILKTSRSYLRELRIPIRGSLR